MCPGLPVTPHFHKIGFKGHIAILVIKKPTQMDPQQHQQVQEGQVLFQNLGSISFNVSNQSKFWILAHEDNELPCLKPPKKPNLIQ